MEEWKENKTEEFEDVNIERFFHAIVSRWWMVALIFVVVVVPWILYIKSQPPVYEAEAWISFENMTQNVTESQIQSRIMKLKSRKTAEEVTAELGLTQEMGQLPNKQFIKREDVFKTFFTTKNPVPGFYMLCFQPSGQAVLMLDSKRLLGFSRDEAIKDTLSVNGIYFSLVSGLSPQISTIPFRVKNFRSAVESLVSREVITTSQAGDLMKISLRDQNPVLASQTVNMLTELFIRKSLEMRQEDDRIVRDIIKEQLDVVQSELTKSDAEIKSFRGEHLAGLDQETRAVVDGLEVLERTATQLKLQKGEMEKLLNRLNPSSADLDVSASKHYIYRQIAQQSVFDNDAEMMVARRELNDLDQQINNLLQKYPASNPTIMEVSENIQMLEDKIFRLATAKVKDMDASIQQTNSRIDDNQNKLVSVPSEELRYIKLQRQNKINEEIYQILLRRYKEAQISEAVASENVTILDSAITPEHPISGDKKKKAMIGIFGGLFLGIGFVLVLEMADKRIKSRNDVKRYLNLPMLGVIPKVKFDDYELQDSEKAKSISSQIVTHDYSPTPVGEAYRSLRTSLLFSKTFGPVRSIAIGSVAPGEGKSFTATNLAITLAQQKSKTLLIDADLRRGVLHNTFNCPKKPGLTNYLTGVASLEDVLNETYIPNLTLITCGSLIPNPSELLGSVRMKRFIEGIINRFDFIIFDTPPLMAATDTIILGTLVDGVAMLIRSGRTKRQEVQRRLELFQDVHAKILGVILNCAGVEIAHEGYSYYRY